MTSTVPTIAAVLPPLDARAPSTATWLFTIWASAVAIGFLPWAVRRAVRHRDPLPLLMMCSGMLAALNEPMIDHLGHCWFPVNLPLTVYRIFGVHIPMLVIPGYAFVGGVAVYVAYRRLARGVTRREVMVIWAALALSDALLEYPGVAGKVYMYYGTQPFSLLRFPWWWAALNGTAMLTSAFFLWWLAPRVAGARLAVLLLVAPTGILVAYAAAGWPTMLALNSQLAPAWMWLAATVTIGLCAIIARVIGAIVSDGGAPLTAPARPPAAATPRRNAVSAVQAPAGSGRA